MVRRVLLLHSFDFWSCSLDVGARNIPSPMSCALGSGSLSVVEPKVTCTWLGNTL